MRLIKFVFIVAIIAGIAYLGYLGYFFIKNKSSPPQPTQPPQQTQPQSSQPQSSQPQSSQSQSQSSQPQSSQSSQPLTSPPKNICDRGPQSKLNNKTCKEISDMKLQAMFAGEQIGYMHRNSINYKELGFKYNGEDCWFEPLGNCIVPTCINENSKVDKDLITCSLRYKAAQNKDAALWDPLFVPQVIKYNITSLS